MLHDPKQHASFTLTESNGFETTLSVWQSTEDDLTLLEITNGFPDAEEEKFVSVKLNQAAKEFLLQTLFKTVPRYGDAGEERG